MFIIIPKYFRDFVSTKEIQLQAKSFQQLCVSKVHSGGISPNVNVIYWIFSASNVSLLLFSQWLIVSKSHLALCELPSRFLLRIIRCRLHMILFSHNLNLGQLICEDHFFAARNMSQVSRRPYSYLHIENGLRGNL